MTNRERLVKTLRFEKVDRLPVIEWAHWWDKTVERWHGEGLPSELRDPLEIREFFGLDRLIQLGYSPMGPDCPQAQGHGMPIVYNEYEYRYVKRYLYPRDAVDQDALRSVAQKHASGDVVIWFTLEGFFWFPRTLLGIENHLTAFYDSPALMHEMNEHLLQFNLRVIDQICEVLAPDFMTFAEDMSYNHGPMLSKEHFEEFMAPYYRRILPVLEDRGIVSIIDTDGDITIAAQWFEDVGARGLLPLERMAGVDVNQLRRDHPRLNMIGAFDKTVMHLGEERIRQEFERLMPVLKQGGYIPACDHQTPPGVSIEDYRLYVRLLKEYCQKAME